jgi:hypothetical protein
MRASLPHLQPGLQLTLPLMAATSAMLSSASPCFLLPFFLLGFGGARGSAVGRGVAATDADHAL